MGRVINLFGDKGGESLDEWKERLEIYLDEREAVEHLRSRHMPDPPWPGDQNPMMGYLITRAQEIAAKEGQSTALVWLAAHAWFEGGLDAIHSADK